MIKDSYRAYRDKFGENKRMNGSKSERQINSTNKENKRIVSDERNEYSFRTLRRRKTGTKRVCLLTGRFLSSFVKNKVMC